MADMGDVVDEVEPCVPDVVVEVRALPTDDVQRLAVRDAQRVAEVPAAATRDLRRRSRQAGCVAVGPANEEVRVRVDALPETRFVGRRDAGNVGAEIAERRHELEVQVRRPAAVHPDIAQAGDLIARCYRLAGYELERLGIEMAVERPERHAFVGLVLQQDEAAEVERRLVVRDDGDDAVQRGEHRRARGEPDVERPCGATGAARRRGRTAAPGRSFGPRGRARLRTRHRRARSVPRCRRTRLRARPGRAGRSRPPRDRGRPRRRRKRRPGAQAPGVPVRTRRTAARAATTARRPSRRRRGTGNVPGRGSPPRAAPACARLRPG